MKLIQAMKLAKNFMGKQDWYGITLGLVIIAIISLAIACMVKYLTS